MGLNFTAVDFETANRQRGSVCSVGLAKVRDGEIVHTSSWIVDPPGGRFFEEGNIRTHGITEADLEGGRSWRASLTGILEITNGDILAHHGMFDMQALVGACTLTGIPAPDMESVDTLALSRAMLKLSRFGLTDVAKSFDLPQFAHHKAEDDAKTCARILVELTRPHGSLDGLLSASRVRKSTIRSGRLLSAIELPEWVAENIRQYPLGSLDHNAWIDRVLAHPDGRAAEGTPCISCDSPIDKKTNYKYKDRHCCTECADKLKRHAKKYAQSQVAG